MRACSFNLLASFLIFTVGCGGVPSAGRLPISGEVQLDGKPLDQGMIHFEPAPDLKKRMDAGAVITNGKYQIDADHGLIPGKYSVSISSYVKGPASDDPMKAPAVAPKERIADKYNTKSTVAVDVVAGKNKFDFKVESAPQ
jgi:hypothetical protein